MITNTKDLSGVALDWAVAKVIGRNMVSMGGGEYGEWDESDPIAYDPLPKYSMDWAYTGPLIEDRKITIRNDKYTCAAGSMDDLGEHELSLGKYWSHAETPLTAACRAIVAAELGEEVDIPGDLIEGGE